MNVIETKHGKFTRNTMSNMSAEEVYEEWLASKDREIPAQEDLEKAKLEIATLNLLTDLGVI